MFAMLSERVCTAELSNLKRARANLRAKSSRDLVTSPIFGSLFYGGDASIGGRFMMLLKKSPPQLRFIFLRAASKTTRAFSHCCASLESFVKAKWQMMRRPKRSTICTDVYEFGHELTNMV